MSYTVPSHFSHKLEFKFNRLPAKISDRTRWQFMLPGLVFGALLFALGLYEMFSGFKYTNANVAEIVPLTDLSQYEPFISPVVFDAIFMIVGLGMMLAAACSYIRYRKFIFDGKTVNASASVGSFVNGIWKEKSVVKVAGQNEIRVKTGNVYRIPADRVQ